MVWTQNILSFFMCGRKTFVSSVFAPKVAFSNLPSIVWTRPKMQRLGISSYAKRKYYLRLAGLHCMHFRDSAF